MAREVLLSSTECSWIQHTSRSRKHRMLSQDELSHWGRESISVVLWGGGVVKLRALLTCSWRRVYCQEAIPGAWKMKRTALMIRNPACNSEMTLSLNYWHLQGRCFQCLITFSALGKVRKIYFWSAAAVLPSTLMVTWLSISELPKVHTEWDWPQLPVDGCKFFRSTDKRWLFSRTKAWNETYQHDRYSIFQHHWLHSEPLIIQGCHRPGQSHFQAPPKRQKAAWNFSNQNFNSSPSLAINLLADLIRTLCSAYAMKEGYQKRSQHVQYECGTCQGKFAALPSKLLRPPQLLSRKKQQGHRQLGRHCDLHLTHLTLSIIGVFNTRKRR